LLLVGNIKSLVFNHKALKHDYHCVSRAFKFIEMKNFLKELVVALIVASIAYIAISLIAKDFNMFNWPYLTLLIYVLVVGYNLFELETDKDE
jgi:flagellar biosynthesis protein FlhB